jgi:hypothetical protein
MVDEKKEERSNDSVPHTMWKWIFIARREREKLDTNRMIIENC